MISTQPYESSYFYIEIWGVPLQFDILFSQKLLFVSTFVSNIVIPKYKTWFHKIHRHYGYKIVVGNCLSNWQKWHKQLKQAAYVLSSAHVLSDKNLANKRGYADFEKN